MKNEINKNHEYDSTPDTVVHMNNINNVMRLIVISELYDRANNHDRSKLESPEKETYDKYIPLLRTAKYGTDEYKKIRDNMQKEGLQHHYDVNRHHPEHFKNMVNDMNLVDFVEMICDWFAASLRSDTTFIDGLDTNINKYDLPDMVVNIIKNTYNDYFKDFEKLAKGIKDEDYIKDLKLSVYENHMNALITDSERDKLLSNIFTLENSTKNK